MDYTQQRIEKAIKEKQARIDKAMDRKSKEIAFFNANNCAVQVISNCILEYTKDEDLKRLLQSWRDWFYQEYLTWFFENILPTLQEPKTQKEKEAMATDALVEEGLQLKYEEDEEIKRLKAEAEYGY